MLKVALLGTGVMGSVHGNGYKNVCGAKVVAVCDLREEKGKAVASLHQANYYDNFDEMMRSEEIDAVDICLPTYLHKEFALKAIEQGKHVFCEKPIALNIEDAEEMVAAARKKGVKFSVGHVVRFFPSYKQAAEVVKSGKIGQVKLIRTTRTGAFPSWNWNNWYSNYDLSGGPLLDLVIHDFDWIRYNFGEIERVYARSFNGTVERKEHCMTTLRLKSGAIAHVEGSWAYPDGATFGTTLELIGTEGQLEFDSRKSSPIVKHIPNGLSTKIALESPLPSWQEPYTMEIQEFVNSIIEDREPLVTGEEAVSALRISLAAIEASKEAAPVVLGGEQ
jgi:predicted dehydrogenase